MDVTTLNAEVTPGTTKAQNVDFFDSDLNIVKDGINDVVVFISLDTSVKIEVTLDGTNYDTINEDLSLTADSLYEFGFKLKKADAFNIRTPTVGGCDVNICRVIEEPVEYV